MKLDVMNTQTGGEGETIQSSNPNQETPEQYDVKVNPPKQTNTTPTEPVSPVIQQPIVANTPAPEMPIVEGNKPVNEDVGYMDWFSGDTVDSVLNDQLDENEVIGSEVQAEEQFVNNPLSNISPKSVAEKEQDSPLSGIKVKPSFITPNTLPTLPLGVDAKQMEEVRTKYRGYDIKTDAFGKITATKKSEEPLAKTQKKQQPVVKTPPVKEYSFPGSVNKYAVINDQWNTKAKGTNEWVVIDEPSRIKMLNSYHNKAVSMPLSEKDKVINKGGNILGSQGFAPSLKTNQGVSKDINGDWVTNSSTPHQALFTQDKPFGTTMAVNSNSYYQDEKIGLENQRAIELQYAKTDAQRKQVNDNFDRLTSQLTDKQKGEEAWIKGNNASVAKEMSKPATPKVKQTIDVVKALNLNINPVNIDLLQSQIRGGNYVNDIVSRSIEAEKDENKTNTIAQAEAFANKDLDTWRKVYGQHLTDSQFDEFKRVQQTVKQTLLEGGDDISDHGVSKLGKFINTTTEQFNNTLAVNTELNKAAYEGKTVSEYQLDKKKLFASTIADDLGDANLMGRTKNLFNASAKMHDFMLEQMKDGKIIQDEKGMYRISQNLSKEESNYLTQKMAVFTAEYEKIKNTEYNTLQDDLAFIRGKRKNVQLSMDSVKRNMEKLTPGTPEYLEAKSKLEKASATLKKYDSSIDKLKNGNRTFFLTEPKEVVKSIAPFSKNSSAYAIFSSIDKNLSPKQRFDMGYALLFEENKKLAEQYGIDTGKLDQIGQNFRSMLDWESVGVNLTEEEKKYFANKKILYSLAPLYLNNENGITEESAGFFDSFWNTFNQTLVGTTAAGSGYMNQTAVVQEQLNKIKELGYTEKDLESPIALKDLEDRKNVSWISGEGAGEIIAPTAAIILELVATKKLAPELLGMGSKTVNLMKTIDKTGSIAKYGDKLTKTLSAFDSALKSTKTGKFIKESVEEGVEFEAAGTVFGSGEEELNFTSGFLGSLAGKGIVSMFSKIPASKLAPVVKSIFGENTDKAIKTFQKSGAVLARGGGEVSEEFTQELVSIYNSTLDSRGFWDEVENRFGSYDQVMKFVATSFLMGGAFGMKGSDTATEMYNDMDTEDKAKIDSVVAEVRNDVQEAQEKTEAIADEAVSEVTIDQDIDNDFKTEANDSENIAGQPSVVGEGETAVETKPDTQTSVEKTEAGGVLETPPEEVKPRTGAPSATGKTDILDGMKVSEEKDQFDEAKAIKRLSPIKRKDAVKAFDEKHGKGSYERVEKINTNFGKIVSKLKGNDLIEKKC